MMRILYKLFFSQIVWHVGLCVPLKRPQASSRDYQRDDVDSMAQSLGGFFGLPYDAYGDSDYDAASVSADKPKGLPSTPLPQNKDRDLEDDPEQIIEEMKAQQIVEEMKALYNPGKEQQGLNTPAQLPPATDQPSFPRLVAYLSPNVGPVEATSRPPDLAPPSPIPSETKEYAPEEEEALEIDTESPAEEESSDYPDCSPDRILLLLRIWDLNERLKNFNGTPEEFAKLKEEERQVLKEADELSMDDVQNYL